MEWLSRPCLPIQAWRQICSWPAETAELRLPEIERHRDCGVRHSAFSLARSSLVAHDPHLFFVFAIAGLMLKDLELSDTQLAVIINDMSDENIAVTISAQHQLDTSHADSELKNRLVSAGRCCVNTPDDGNCEFHALTFGLCHKFDRGAAIALRQFCVYSMEVDAEQLARVCDEHNQTCPQHLRNLSASGLCEHLRQNNALAVSSMIIPLCLALGICVRIYSPHQIDPTLNHTDEKRIDEINPSGAHVVEVVRNSVGTHFSAVQHLSSPPPAEADPVRCSCCCFKW